MPMSGDYGRTGGAFGRDLGLSCCPLPGSPDTASRNLKVKVLDFVKSGGPILTIDRTVFELWLGRL